MKRILLLGLVFGLVASVIAAEPKKAKKKSSRDIAVVRDYIERVVGEKALAEIKAREGGEDFLKRFFANQTWMEQFAGSGPWKGKDQAAAPGIALKALDMLDWNDEQGFMKTKLGRNVATALALNHAHDWSDEKLVETVACYRDWQRDGTLHITSEKLDTRQWREVLTFGQNENLDVENLRWIHDYATIPANRYYGICWTCHYRLFNCFGDSVHGWMYYAPWAHRWNTQELRYRVGGVCGALSKFGSHCAASHGIRSFTAGQPGHCAFMLWDFNTGRWGQGYAVTSHTGAHFSLGGDGWAASEEQERYFSNPKRMNAEYLRWKGEYAKAMALVEGNWQAGREWANQLLAEKAPRAKWDEYGATVLRTFATAPSEGWQLYFIYIDQLPQGADRIEAARRGLLAMHEHEDKTVEPLYFDERVLNPLENKLGKNKDALWQLLPAMLDGQAKSRTFYRQTIDWAAGRLMTGGEDTKRFLAAVTASAEKSGASLDFKGMILKAVKAKDLAMYKQVYSMLDKLAPDSAPKPNGKNYPTEDYGGKLLSCEGMLLPSSTSQWDVPVNYRNALDAADYQGGNAFHTGKETAPHALVMLPGDCDIAGFTIVNSGGGGNGGRQFPMKVWLSSDGVNFTEVHSVEKVQGEIKFKLPAPVKAKYIKVGRAPGLRNDFFHLHKLLVYGRRLY